MREPKEVRKELSEAVERVAELERELEGFHESDPALYCTICTARKMWVTVGLSEKVWMCTYCRIPEASD